MEPKVNQFAVRIARSEIDRFSEIARGRGFSISEAMRLLVRRVNRGSIRLPAKVTEHAVEDRAGATVEAA